jgi:hypothetical protein
VATHAELRGLGKLLRLRPRDVREIASDFVSEKIGVYLDTLHDLADEFGYVPIQIDLSDEVLRPLVDEARQHARYIVDTFNGEMEAFLERNAERPAGEILQDFHAWAADRFDARGEQTAITEAYNAHADATVAFFAANEIPVEFDFGGHGDDAAQCAVCQALEASGPHPLERVVELGNPHPGCRQEWHPRVPDDAQLPAEDDLQLGAAAGGLLGRQPLVIEHGNHDRAAAFVRDLAGGSSQPE